MKVLLLHNRYRMLGGEDVVALSEAKLLRDHGVDVTEVDYDNEIHDESLIVGNMKLALRSNWSKPSYRAISEACRKVRPDVAHVHNFWLTLSPSVHSACKTEGVPTVQTLHNFRLFCTNALFKRDGGVCLDCLGKAPWRGVIRRCYRHSFVASAAVARMIYTNRRRGTWDREVDAFVALSEHSRGKFIEGGLPRKRIFVKPNFVEDPVHQGISPSRSNLILYAGRLSEEKGVSTLVRAWAQGGLRAYGQLLIIGDGPTRYELEAEAASLGLGPSEVEFAGQRGNSEVQEAMGRARAVVMPSLFFECFPRIVPEAYALGRPVIGSRIGALTEILTEDTGMVFEARNHVALAECLRLILTNSPLADEMGAASRREFVAKYTPESNWRRLMSIYRFAIDHAEKKVPAALQDVEPAQYDSERIARGVPYA